MSEEMSDPLLRAHDMTAQMAPSHGGERPSSPLESCLTIEFEVAGLPSRVVKIAAFAKILEKRMGLRLGESSLRFAREMPDWEELTFTEFDRRIPVVVRFQNGRLQFEKEGETKFVLISFVHLLGGGDVIRASVFGDSDDAELAVARVYECLWEAAGQKRQWAEGVSAIHAKGYATSTHEVLDCSFGRLFSRPVERFLEGLASSEDGLGAQMGVRPIDASTGEAEVIEAHVAVNLRELRFDVPVIDLRSGRTWETTVVLAPKARTTRGRGLYQVTTELPLRLHERLVSQLRTALDAETE